MATDWAIKELITAVKMNQLSVPKYTEAEQQAILDINRLQGMPSFNKDKNTLDIYHRGTGSNFHVTRLTNFLFRDATQIGIGSSLQTVYDEAFINTQGKMNTNVYVTIEYLLEASQSYEITATATDGSSPDSDTISGTAGGAPTVQYKTFVLDTSGFTIDDIINIQLKVKNAQIQYVEFRGV